MQYSGQYYHNDYGMDPNGYYDPKQSNYYENMGYQHGADYQDVYMPSNNNMQSDSGCENFGYPQYFEAANAHQQHVPNIAPAHPMQHNAMPPTGAGGQNFVHGPQTYHQSINAAAAAAAAAGGTGVVVGPLATMENSNSSSDFNFLSNLANDFAPEYYQLS